MAACSTQVSRMQQHRPEQTSAELHMHAQLCPTHSPDRLSRAWHQPHVAFSHQPANPAHLLQSQFVSQLPQHALSSEELAHNSRAEAQHGQAGDEDLIVGGEPNLKASKRSLALLLLGGRLLGELQADGSSRVGGQQGDTDGSVCGQPDD